MRSWSSEWFAKCVGVRGLVSRREYVVAGVVLFLAKYLIEAIVLHQSGEGWLEPTRFLLPYLAGPIRFVGQGDSTLVYWLAFASLPFLWIGTSMSVRRAVDAGWPAWIGFLFMVPVVHYVVLLALALKPGGSRAIGSAGMGAYRAPAAHHRQHVVGGDLPRSQLVLRSALLSAAAGQIVLNLLVRFFDYDGRWLFLAAPIVMGATASASYYYAERAILEGTPPRVPWRPRSKTFWVLAVILAALALGGGLAMYQGLARAGTALQIAVPAVFVCILAAALGVASDSRAETRRALTPVSERTDSEGRAGR
ncbi:MAG: DUF805 domain-containing protein [Polyangiaceae bacterium]|nr:DUF805 domain-containing protein [Polyangiaceae bacterium]